MQCQQHGTHITHICLDEDCGQIFCEYCLLSLDEAHENLNYLEDARVMAIKTLNALENIYTSEIDKIEKFKLTKKDTKESNFQNVDSMLKNSQNVVQNLVAAYFEELRQEWLQTYVNPPKQGDKLGEDIMIKKMRQKVSKIRKLQESFVLGDFEGDLL
jgi:hypothetical protein